jgi:Asp-tRNA(Asn)/Glu-tRNA(Gln) amidotransferase A subunit family amidase
VELADVESATATAREHTMGINAWEWRWPLGSYVARDPAGLSESALERHARAASMTQAEYVELLAHRDAARASLKKLEEKCAALISVTAPGAAPVGLSTTGDPIFVVPGSYLGVPGVSLPLLQAEGLPLGLQLLGFPDHDATLFGHAAWVEQTLSGG